MRVAVRPESAISALRHRQELVDFGDDHRPHVESTEIGKEFTSLFANIVLHMQGSGRLESIELRRCSYEWQRKIHTRLDLSDTNDQSRFNSNSIVAAGRF